MKEVPRSTRRARSRICNESQVADKERVGEFQELGFKVAFQTRDGLSPDEREELLDAFIHDAIEANGLSFGGGGNEMAWDGFVCRAAPRTSATQEDREAVERWLSSSPADLVVLNR